MVWGIEMTIDKAGKLKAHKKHADKVDSVLDTIPKLETRIGLILESVDTVQEYMDSVLTCQNTVLAHMEESNSILDMISKLKTRVNWAIVLLILSIILMIFCLMK